MRILAKTILSSKSLGLVRGPLYRHRQRFFQTSATLNRGIRLALSGYDVSYYEQERKKSLQLQAPEYFNFARDFLDKWAQAEKSGQRSTNTPAFWWLDEDGRSEIKLSFQDLSRISRRVANALVAGCGLARQDVVFIILPKVPEWWFLHLACNRADLTSSAGTMLLRSKDIHHRLKLSKAKCIITTSDMVPHVDQVAGDCEDLRTKIVVGEASRTRPGWTSYKQVVEKASEEFECVNTKSSDPMMLFCTSGTTGAPKMTKHSHSSYGFGHILTARYMLQLRPDSILWNLSDTGWAKSAWSNLFSPWIHGSCVFIHNAPKFDPADIPKNLAQFPITHLCSSPTALRMIARQNLQQYKFQALYFTMTAGEPLNPELLETWKQGTGLDVYEGYGQTETTAVCCRPPQLPYKPESMGKSVPGYQVHIVDDEGRVVEPGVEGNIGIRCKPDRPVGLFSGYLNEPVRTAAAYKGDYYLLGDRGYMDEEGYVYFVGRADDIIISSGYRIGPFEVESALVNIPQ